MYPSLSIFPAIAVHDIYYIFIYFTQLVVHDQLARQVRERGDSQPRQEKKRKEKRKREGRRVDIQCNGRQYIVCPKCVGMRCSAMVHVDCRVCKRQLFIPVSQISHYQSNVVQRMGRQNCFCGLCNSTVSPSRHCRCLRIGQLLDMRQSAVHQS